MEIKKGPLKDPFYLLFVMRNNQNTQIDYL